MRRPSQALGQINHRPSLLLDQVAIHDHRHLSQYPRPALSDCSPALIASTVLQMVWLMCGPQVRASPIPSPEPSRARARSSPCQRVGLGKVAQQIDVDVLGPALGQNGIDRAMGFDQACRLSRADPQHDPPAALPDVASKTRSTPRPPVSSAVFAATSSRL